MQQRGRRECTRCPDISASPLRPITHCPITHRVEAASLGIAPRCLDPLGTGSANANSTSSVTAAGTDDHLFVVLATPPGPQRRLVANALMDRGIRIAAVGSLHELRTALDRSRPDVVIVDVALAANQVDILGLVSTAGAPLIATSVRNPALRVELLLAGADDCLPARFVPEELIARIAAVVRRSHRATPPATMVRSGPFRIDVQGRRVRVRGSEIFLTAREFDLLSYFIRHSGETLSRDRLLTEVWGYTVGDAATVTVHVRRLRCKVEDDPNRPEHIRTVWGIGYRFCADDHRPGTASPTMAVGSE